MWNRDYLRPWAPSFYQYRVGENIIGTAEIWNNYGADEY